MWSKGDILTFPKKGNPSLATNYRGITLNCISAKLNYKTILKRIRSFIDPLLHSNQNGFHLITNTNNAEDNRRHQRKNLPPMIIFINFCKAFNAIDRSKMFVMLLG